MEFPRIFYSITIEALSKFCKVSGNIEKFVEISTINKYII